MMATIRLDRPGAPIGIGKGWGPVIANFAKLPTWQGLAPQQNRRVSFSPMKAPALILLLLLMLAPRLNAAMPVTIAVTRKKVRSGHARTPWRNGFK